MIYLDYSATTPTSDEVLDTFVKASRKFIGNPNSLHKLGVESKELIDASTKQIADILKISPKEIIYTSGASESNNMAIKGICLQYQNRGKHIITTNFEHSSIYGPISYLQALGFEVDFVKITDDGIVDIDHLKSLLRNDTILVSISMVDSEIGLKQPIQEIAKILEEYPKCYFHVDCTQAFGKIPVDLSGVDMASMSAHKIYGLKGIGMLIKKENISIEPIIHGGKSTTVFRSGTPALPLIVSLMKAMKLIIPNISENTKYVSKLNKKICNKLREYPSVHINSTENSIPYTINFSLKGIKPETFVHALDEREIYISTKSACSGTNSMSNSVYALTKDKELSNGSLRISLSYMTTEEEVDKFLSVFDECIKKLEM